MKKTFTILSASLIILIAFKANAQDKDTKTYAKSYLSIIGGISSPTGDFANATYSNYQSGFAKRGITGGLDGAFYLYKNLAIGVTLSFQDQGELNATDVQNLSNGYNTSFFKDETVITAVNRYNNINLMGGPQYSFIYKNFTLDLRAEAGIIKSLSTPSFIMYFDNSTDASTAIEQHSSLSKAFAYGGSAGLRYSLGAHWDVGLKANYIKSDGFDITYSNDAGTTGRYSAKQPVSEIQITLGIALKF
jgi:hypothetical protein